MQAQINALIQDVRVQREWGKNLERQLTECRDDMETMRARFEQELQSNHSVTQSMAELSHRIWYLKKSTDPFDPDDLDRLGVVGNAARGSWP
jgi:hypothetical protein